ncbi:hypothetical protein [Aliagarivorans marinus]|uniref:hypothetical protein n=1 Tax=Aliagarivorans marinus TaxID=561965 RepID=UPI00040A8246|nr:hypothetical protein [Aliagarivorans marinus]
MNIATLIHQFGQQYPKWLAKDQTVSNRAVSKAREEIEKRLRGELDASGFKHIKTWVSSGSGNLSHNPVIHFADPRLSESGKEGIYAIIKPIIGRTNPHQHCKLKLTQGFKEAIESTKSRAQANDQLKDKALSIADTYHARFSDLKMTTHKDSDNLQSEVIGEKDLSSSRWGDWKRELIKLLKLYNEIADDTTHRDPAESDKTNYYILGTGYSVAENTTIDVYQDMLEQSVISVGFYPKHDLSHLVGLGREEIQKQLKADGFNTTAVTALKHFLSLRPGDLVALKTRRRPEDTLKVSSIAIVKGNNNPIYQLSEHLTHTIAVDFIDYDLSIPLPTTYRWTMHHITDRKTAESIFGAYASDTESPKPLPIGSGDTPFPDTSDIDVRGRGRTKIRQVHKMLQNKLLEELCKEYDHENLHTEHDYVDMQVILADRVILFEVKTALCANRCLREALGQILQYGHRYALEKKRVEYVIVGQHPVNKESDSYFQHLRRLINAPLSYRQIKLSR